MLTEKQGQILGMQEIKLCPLCEEKMALRENTTTFWEKQKERYAYYCSNSNCLHKIPVTQKEIEILRLEESLLKWEIDLDTIEQHILEKYQLKALLHCLKKTLEYLRKGDGSLSAKEFFLQELENPGKQKKRRLQLKIAIIPTLLLLLTLGAIALFGSPFHNMMEASLLSLFH